MTRHTKFFYVHVLNVDGKRYLVSFDRLKNDVNGNARYAGTIIVDDGSDRLQGYTYSFTGHGMAFRDEARWVLNYHLGKID